MNQRFPAVWDFNSGALANPPGFQHDYIYLYLKYKGINMLKSNCSVALGKEIRKTEFKEETDWVVIPFIIYSKP